MLRKQIKISRWLLRTDKVVKSGRVMATRIGYAGVKLLAVGKFPFRVLRKQIKICGPQTRIRKGSEYFLNKKVRVEK